MTGRPKRRVGVPKAGSGLDGEGRWVPVFEGQRAPFRGGEATSHGSYVSPVQLGERPAEIADAVRGFVPGWSPAVELSLQQYALTLTRIERAAAALEAVEAGLPEADRLKRKGERDQLLSLQASLRSWIRLSVRLAAELGLTPSSSARMMRDAGIGANAAAQHAALLERYRGVA